VSQSKREREATDIAKRVLNVEMLLPSGDAGRACARGVRAALRLRRKILKYYRANGHRWDATVPTAIVDEFTTAILEAMLGKEKGKR